MTYAGWLLPGENAAVVLSAKSPDDFDLGDHCVHHSVCLWESKRGMMWRSMLHWLPDGQEMPAPDQTSVVKVEDSHSVEYPHGWFFVWILNSQPSTWEACIVQIWPLYLVYIFICICFEQVTLQIPQRGIGSITCSKHYMLVHTPPTQKGGGSDQYWGYYTWQRS